MSTESLQKVFKTLADPTRVRILALLEREELAVQELMEVLVMAQSRVSRHLGILREVGLVSDRREGTFVFYRLAQPGDRDWRDVWALVSRGLTEDPSASRDRAALERVIGARADRSRSFFDSVGPEWDALRKVFNDDALRARAMAHLIPTGLRVADIGTGTGVLALELARLGVDVVAVDHSARMLEAARTKLEREGIVNVDLRRGEASALPLEADEVDAAIVHMVLQYLPSPADALCEMARVTRPGGRVLVVDFVAHDREWMRQELGVYWLGFAAEEVRSWFASAGLDWIRVEPQAVVSRGADLPETFIASGRCPGGEDAG